MVTYGGFREFGGPRGWLAGLEEALTADKGRDSLSFFSFPFSFFSFPFSFFSFPFSFLFQPDEKKRERKREEKGKEGKREEKKRKNSFETRIEPAFGCLIV